MSDLNGRVALVTGAARGLGEGIANSLARAGATVVCADLADASPVAMTLEATFPGTRATAISLDVTDRAAVSDALDQILAEHGRFDILVNNAGVVHGFAPLQEIDPVEVVRTINVNLIGTMHCSAESVRRFGTGSGRIINVASQYGLQGRPGYAVYSATKAGVIGLTQSLALEVASAGITVNAVCPGTMLTEMVRATFEERAKAAGMSASGGQQLLDEFPAGTIPVGRMGTPADVGAMVAWIASDAASFTTGAAFNVTGGETLY